MDDLIQVIVLVDGTTISKIGQVVSELGEPDCMFDPTTVVDGLRPWLENLTRPMTL